ncbi:hypothetical protein LIER_33458 [Lithospermum erythrorhizon]|uniref:F-box domain-containing protein n=1 Tax=Lithospermum erythrorhizon TaxID=34254 RepID=A0AAV3S086_LITER
MASQDLKNKFNWSELSLDLLCIVFSNLPLRTCWVCKTVCKSWRSGVDEYLSSTAHLNRPPLLMVPLRENDPDNSVRVFCPEDRTHA